MEGYDQSTYGDRFADVYDRWYPEVSDVEGTVAKVGQLAEMAGARSVLELGIGTGRLALPMVAAGLSVTGIDSSDEMLSRLASKEGSAAIDVAVGDMAEPDRLVTGPFAVALVAFNTFFNLSSGDAQQSCFDGVARLLQPGGHLVIEVFVPNDEQPLAAVSPTRITADHVVLTATIADPDAQTIAGQHIDVTEDGISLRPWFLRYATPDELDQRAQQAGLELAERSADWHGTAFDDDSAHHVSVYRRTG